MASENSQMVVNASQIFLILWGMESMTEGWHCGLGRLMERESTNLSDVRTIIRTTQTLKTL